MNMPFSSREQVEFIRKNYPPGTRVMLNNMLCQYVFCLMGVFAQVKIQLFPRLGVPDEFVVLRYDEVHGVLPQGVFSVEVFPAYRVQEALSVHCLGDRRACQLQEGGHHIPQFCQVAADGAVLTHISLRPR